MVYSAGELAGLPDVDFVGAAKFSEIYILHYITSHYYIMHAFMHVQCHNVSNNVLFILSSSQAIVGFALEDDVLVRRRLDATSTTRDVYDFSS